MECWIASTKKEFEKEVIDLRRKFHRYPEEGWMEYKTTIDIIEYLKKLGLNIFYGKIIHSNRQGLPSEKKMKQNREEFMRGNKEYDFSLYGDLLHGYTGTVALLDTKRPGKTTVLRFDIDGLSINESQCKEHKPYSKGFASKHQGYMHACGHDAHIAIGLTVAKYVCNNKDKLCGKIYFIFQPAEEGVRGARSLCNSELLSPILNSSDYFLSSHIGFSPKNNEIACSTTGFLGTEKIDVSYKGVSSHAGVAPDKGKNALLAACALITNLYGISQHSEGISRVNVGKLNAGTSRNTIPDRAEIQMEIRSNKKSVLTYLHEKVENMIKGASIMYGVDNEEIITGSADSFDTINEEFTESIEHLVQNLKLNPIHSCDFGASEDVTCYMNRVEKCGGIAAYFIVGTDRKYPHHNEMFDIDESNLINGVMLYVDILYKITNAIT